MRTIRLEAISKSYEEKTILDSFDLTLSTGRIYALYGPSGCGKSTLLHLIGGVVRYDSGTLTGMMDSSGSNDPSSVRVGMVFQEDRLLPWATVMENLRFVIGSQSDDAILEILEVVGLGGEAGKFPHELSGGMKRRVALARCLAYNPSVLLMDEPFTGMDLELKRRLIQVVGDLFDASRNDSTNNICVMSTHHLDEALILADEILVVDGIPLTIKGRFDLSGIKNDPNAMKQAEAAILSCSGQTSQTSQTVQTGRTDPI